MSSLSATPQPWLTIVAGNSRTKFARLDVGPQAVAVRHFAAFPVGAAPPWPQLQAWFSAPPQHSLAAGSNPAGVTRVLESWPAHWPAATVIRHAAQVPIANRADQPERVGLDRLFNALASRQFVRPGQAALIVDSGTATTVNAVSGSGAFLGGAILPGLELSARALHEYTALLPLVPKDDLLHMPLAALGKNTRDAMRSGLLWGQLGAVRELVERLTRELAHNGEAQPPCLLMTGGGGPILAPHWPTAIHEPALGLLGLLETGRQLHLQQASGHA